MLSQTAFLRKILFTTINHCCDTIEIICPCTKEELEKLVNFLYHGEIQCENDFESFKSQEDLSKIFGFPEDFNIEFQIATLLDDPALSTIPPTTTKAPTTTPPTTTKPPTTVPPTTTIEPTEPPDCMSPTIYT